ncbi:nuclear pore complex protein-like protein Nup107 [Byssothecium circinans]|uniref:Nuclear pore complex protein n=1 Tax=Byssothecium circinans TaxID=147558 RepID=A0A6A5TTM7_9PLEO|nr:nuclear pore complex protein-like protein Nup107 [Byssothecium circinans]
MASFSYTRRSQPAPAQTHGSRNSFFTASRSAQVSAASDPLQPLRAMADRVGKEVEKFAERVDHWHTHGNEDAGAKFETTVKMVGKFRDLAKSSVDELRKQNDSENRGELDKSIQRRIQTMGPETSSGKSKQPGLFSQSVVSSVETSSTPASCSMQELRNWQAELATWELVSLIVEHYHPKPGTNVDGEKAARLAQVGGKSKYSPKSEIWDRFILADDTAREKKLVLKWLQQTARNTESDIESIVEQWKHVSGKDTNTWTSGWLDTRARIKQAKRMQGVGTPLSRDYQLKSNAVIHPLVTRLDPDAPMRQKRALEESDEYYENALWMVCYEMLRRGEPWEKISDWCKERNEAWRGVSLGVAYDSQPSDGPNMAGNDLGFLYRRICYAASRGARIPYEGAVYALLSGDVKKVKDASRSWDDHLYAYYNSLLLTRFDMAVQQDPTRVPSRMADSFPVDDAMALFTDWKTTNQEVIKLLMRDPATSAQAKSPLKVVQGALISQSVDELLYKVGVAIADLLQNDDRLNLLMLDPDSEEDFPKSKMTKAQRAVTAEDYHATLAKDHSALRILVHVYIIFARGLRTIKPDINNATQSAMNNVVTFYIEFLRLTKRLQLIPIYAAQLESFGAAHCMARVLLDIKNNDEQKRCMNLMEQYGIDYIGAINENFIQQLDATGFVDDKEHTVRPITRYKIVEAAPDQDAYLWPGVRIMHDLPGIEVSPKEEALIESLAWYNHVETDVENTFRDLYTALETFLLNGRVGAAVKLATEMSVEAISLIKTVAFCGYAFDFTVAGAEEQDQLQVSEIMNTSLRSSGNQSIRPSEIPTKEQHAQYVRELRKLSRKYFDLCQLVRAISLFQQWRAEEEKLIQLRTDHEQISMKRVKQLSTTIEALFEHIFYPIEDPVNDSNNRTLWSLYKVYIPEVTIAYLSVLQSGAFFIHRETITKAMDLATVIADSESRWLQKAFLETGRMTELITVLAEVSKAMLRLDEHGDGKAVKKQKRGSKGETLRIWNLKAVN